jgi:GGDEF domain-containing protein
MLAAFDGLSVGPDRAPVRVSIGLTVHEPAADQPSPVLGNEALIELGQTLVLQADRALYGAKRAGGGRAA